MTDAVVAEPRRLDIGAVLSRTVDVLKADLSTYALSSLLLVGLPAFVQQALIAGIERGSTTAFLAIFPVIVVTVLTATTLQAVVVKTAVARLNSDVVPVREVLRSGLRLILPLVGLSIIISVCATLGTILLLVPGLFVLVIWSVAVPARVVEPIGVTDALERSAALTKGDRWAILLLGVVVGVVFILLMSILLGLPSAIFGESSNVVLLVMSPLFSMISSLLTAALGAALYFELRTRKEGAAPASLAAVFA